MQSAVEIALGNAVVAGVLGLLVLAIGRLFPRPALTHCLWLLVLAKLVTPAWFTIPLTLPQVAVPHDVRVDLAAAAPTTKEAPVVASGNEMLEDAMHGNAAPTSPEYAPRRATVAEAAPQTIDAEPDEAPVYHLSLGTFLTAVWVVGAVALLLRSTAHVVRFGRVLKFATPADATLEDCVRRAALGMGLKRGPHTVVVPGMVSPMLWPFAGRVRLILPRELLEDLSDEARQTVIVHELAHYRRGDHWVRAFEMFVSALFWWHPVVWLALREIRRLEEECCDACVVSQLPDERGTYARTLICTIAFLSARPMAVASVSGVLGKGFYHSVEQRVRSIMSLSPTRGVDMSPMMRLALVLFAVAVLPWVPTVGADVPGGTVLAARPSADEPTTFAGGASALGAVADVALSPDGRFVAAGHGLAGGPGAISIWDLQKSVLVGAQAEDRRIISLSYSPDGRLIGYGTWDAVVRIRRTDTLALVQEFGGFQFHPVFAAFSPAGKLFAVAQKEVKLYDAETWKPQATVFETDPVMEKETFHFNGVRFSPDGKRLLACGGNAVMGEMFGRTFVWDVTTGKLICRAEHDGRAFESKFSPDGKLIAAACEDGRVRVHDATTGVAQNVFWIRSTPFYDVSWSRDGRHLVAAAAIKGYAIFDVETGATVKLFAPPPGPKIWLNACEFTPDGARIVTGNSEKEITIFDAKTYEPINRFPSSSATQTADYAVNAVAYSPDGRWIAAGGEDGTVKLQKPGTGEVLKTLAGHADVVAAVAFSPDGALASAGYDKTIKLWDAATGKETRTFTGHDNWVFGIAFSPDGKMLASAGYDKTVRLWDVATGKQSAMIEGGDAAVRTVAFSPDGKLLASAGSDRIVRVWDAVTQAEVAVLKGHEGSVRSVAFSHDGKLLASGAEDNTARLWSTSDWSLRHTLAGHEGMVWSVTFSAGDKNLATGSFDHTIKTWNPATGEVRQTLQGHRDGVASVVFAPDTRAIVSGGLDRTLRIWRAGE